MSTFKLVAGKPTIDKDPNAVLDYSVDWSAWLASADPADSIASHSIVLQPDTGLTKLQSSNSGGIVTFWVSGGVAGTTERVVVRVTTTNGRTDDRSVYLKVKDR